jgi:hypothetical protein
LPRRGVIDIEDGQGTPESLCSSAREGLEFTLTAIDDP